MPKRNRAKKINIGCLFCGVDDKDELHLGKFYKLGEIRAHYYCLLFSSGLMQKGATDDKGILGFMPKDIHKELQRGKRLKCTYCKSNGATIGCISKRCHHAFHLPCGLKNQIMLQFYDEFPAFCMNHRENQPSLKRNTDGIRSCTICWENVVTEVTADTLYPPCCSNGWFHRDCLQTLALSNGYFFKCPLCNNIADFQSEMQRYGIYVPEQDASWEREPGAFSELYIRHNLCNATVCLCPDGRTRDDDGKSISSRWELVLCTSCGSQGMHIACGDLSYEDPVWECPDCENIGSKKATTPKKKPARMVRTPVRNPPRQNRESSSAEVDITPCSENRRYKMRRKNLVVPPSTSSDSSRSSSPACFTSNERERKTPSPSCKLGFRMRRQSSSSHSDSSNPAVNFRKKIFSYDSDPSDPSSPVTSPTPKATPVFSLKGPSCFTSNSSTSNVFGGLKGKYNPSISLSNSYFRVTNPSLNSSNSRSPTKLTMEEFKNGRSFSGTVVLVDSSDEDDDVIPIPVPTPMIIKPIPTAVTDVVNLSSDSDGSKKTVQTLNRVQMIAAPFTNNQENVRSQKRPSTSSSEEEELIVPHPVKKARVLSNHKTSHYEIKESAHTGQLSILKYIPNNSLSGKNTFVPSLKAQRKRENQRANISDCPLKITSFFQKSQDKTYVLNYSDEEDDENVELPVS